MQLKIVLWNANGLAQNTEEVKNYTQNQQIDIMLISETHFTTRSYFKLPNYTIYDTQHPDGTAHGATAILIKNGIKHYLHGHHNLEYLQATSVTVEDWVGPLTIAAIYCPPQRYHQSRTIPTLLSFLWNHEFKILNEGPFPVILGMDFLQWTQMRVDLCSRTYTFAFAPSRVGLFSPAESKEGDEPFLQQLCTDVANITTVMHVLPKDLEWESLKAEFPPYSLLLSARPSVLPMISNYRHHSRLIATIPVCAP